MQQPSWCRRWKTTFCWLSLLLPGVIRAQGDGSQQWAFTTLSTATAGSILSSPAAGPDGAIYIGVEVGASTSASPSGRLFALSPNGSQKWVFTPPTDPDWIDSTPAVAADGSVYLGCWNGVLYALRADGSTRWELKAGAFIASSPALGPDGTIYVGADSDLIAVNPDGTLKWTFPAGDWIDSSPAIAPDGTIVVGSWDGNVYAIRPDGSEKWRFETGGNVTSSPAIAADGTIYVGSRDANLYALTSSGALKWRFDTTDTVETAPALGADGTVYLTSSGGRVFALDRNGAERWRFPRADQPALASIYSSPAVRADGAIIFGSSSNAVYALRPDGTQLWRAPVGEWCDASPLITSNAIYIGCADKKLYAFNSSAGLAASDWPQFRRDGQRTGRSPVTVVAGPAGRLINLSVRTTAGAGDDRLIVGFVVSGQGGRSLLVRGVGPTLQQAFNVAGALDDPRIAMFAGSNQMATNDDWGQAPNVAGISSTASSVGAFPLPGGSRDSAWLNTVAPGDYTVHVSGAGASTGVALMEAYDAGGGATSRLANVSARSAVGTGAGILIAGFVIHERATTILIRGIGPGLAPFNVPGALADPQLQIFRETQLVAENNDWGGSNPATLSSTAQAVGAFALPNGSRDAALFVTLTPGAYTAQVSGVNGTTGVALVEVYEVP